jgi:hypothetical protein
MDGSLVAVGSVVAMEVTTDTVLPQVGLTAVELAMEAVLQKIDGEEPDLILVGGDVAAGPLPRETIERLRNLSLPARFVRGNADRELVTRFDEVQSGTLAPDSSRFPLTWIA